jgi:hypothetical protein
MEISHSFSLKNTATFVGFTAHLRSLTNHMATSVLLSVQLERPQEEVRGATEVNFTRFRPTMQKLLKY